MGGDMSDLVPGCCAGVLIIHSRRSNLHIVAGPGAQVSGRVGQMPVAQQERLG